MSRRDEMTVENGSRPATGAVMKKLGELVSKREKNREMKGG